VAKKKGGEKPPPSTVINEGGEGLKTKKGTVFRGPPTQAQPRKRSCVQAGGGKKNHRPPKVNKKKTKNPKKNTLGPTKKKKDAVKKKRTTLWAGFPRNNSETKKKGFGGVKEIKN